MLLSSPYDESSFCSHGILSPTQLLNTLLDMSNTQVKLQEDDFTVAGVRLIKNNLVNEEHIDHENLE